MKDKIRKAERIVVKIGSALLTDMDSGVLKKTWLHSLCKAVSQYPNKQWLIVSSGAVALGRPSLPVNDGANSSDLTLEQKQAAASIGQVILARSFADAFDQCDRTSAQILLSLGDTEGRRSHLNARATLDTLMDSNIIPVINENDTVATEEIRFGDNDRLAARVAQMVGADLLILFSTTDGLYTKNPDKFDDAQHIDHIDTITAEIETFADKPTSRISTGGMISKIDAAKIATNAGCAVIIADGRMDDPLHNQSRTSFFAAKDNPRNARKKWIQAHLKPQGEIVIDNGAVTALRNGKSLLPIGVTSVSGDFRRGDLVLIKDQDNRLIARGLIAYDRNHALKIAGVQSNSIADIIGFEGRKELVHRDDLVLDSLA